MFEKLLDNHPLPWTATKRSFDGWGGEEILWSIRDAIDDPVIMDLDKDLAQFIVHSVNKP